MLSVSKARICVVGLGYVGLPLAVAFGRLYDTVGYDLNGARIAELSSGFDRTLELDAEELAEAKRLTLTADAGEISPCNVYVVTVPTPIDDARRPDLRALQSASRMIGARLQAGDTVIYESTVYPGCTEDVCVPILERESSLKFNQDFFCGYSPERANPGDRQHRLTTIRKVTAGSTPEVAKFVDELYRSIVTAGTFCAASIRTAEAAKVIENTQRDLNIALVNEFAMIFNRLGIDTAEVLEAASTKWNFLNFRPGLVGGHCIGVDPYYLTHKAQEIGYHPEVILAGRRINDGVGGYIAGRVIRLMASRGLSPVGGRALVLGLAFKENCPDLRNTKVMDLVEELRQFQVQVDICDPWVDPEEARHAYGVELAQPEVGAYDAIVLAVGHREFVESGGEALRTYGRPGAVLYDVKSVLGIDAVDGRL